MPYYAVPGNQATLTTTYKTAAQLQNGTAAVVKRGKVFELLLGVNSNPNATDTFITFDVSRITATGAGANTAWTPTALDPADSAAVLTAGINATAEATAITANSSLFTEGINQRASVRWVASQESQMMVLPSVLNNGLTLRALSTTFTTSVTGQMTFQE
jgi:hypothetical protein